VDFVAKLNTAGFFSSSRDILKESNKIREELNKASQSFLNTNDQKRIVDSLDKIRDVIGRDKSSGMQSAFQNIAAGVNAASLAQTKLALGVGKASENAKELNKWNTYIKNNMQDVAQIYGTLNTQGQLMTGNAVMYNLELSRSLQQLEKMNEKANSITAKFAVLRGAGDAVRDVFNTGAIGSMNNSVMSSIGDEMALTSQIGRSGVASILQGAQGMNAGQPWWKNKYNVSGGLSIGAMLMQQHADQGTIMKSANAGGLGVQAGISTDSEMVQLMMALSAYGPELSASDRMTILAQIQAASKAGGATTGSTTTALTSFLSTNAGFMSGMGAATGATSLLAAASGTGAGPQLANVISTLITKGRKNAGSDEARALEILFKKSSGEIDKMVDTGDYSGLRLNSNFLGAIGKDKKASVLLNELLKSVGLDTNALSVALPAFNASMERTERLRVRPEDAQQQLLKSLEDSRDAFTNLTESLKATVTQSENFRNIFLGINGIGNMLSGVATSLISIITLLNSWKVLKELKTLKDGATAATIAKDAASVGGITAGSALAVAGGTAIVATVASGIYSMIDDQINNGGKGAWGATQAMGGGWANPALFKSNAPPVSQPTMPSDEELKKAAPGLGSTPAQGGALHAHRPSMSPTSQLADRVAVVTGDPHAVAIANFNRIPGSNN
jgi:hypothetical protein